MKDHRKTSGGEICMFWDKLEIDITELDVNGPILPREYKLPGRFDD